jgi:hypothetical protein
VRHTFDGDDDLVFEALRSIGSLNVTRLFEVLDAERFELDERRLDDDEEESHGLPYKLRIALRFLCLFV